MKKKTEKAYFDEQWVQMVTHFKAFTKTGDQEELHLFRVQVKKLRAILELLDSASSRHKLSKDLKPVRQIFKHCGNIRNAYINLQLGARYQLKNEEFIMGQLHVIESGTDEFKEQGKKYLKIIKASYDAIGDDLKAIADDDIIEFYQTNLEQVAQAFTDLQFNDELHRARKQVKTLLYNRKIAAKALDGKLQLDNAYLDKLQDHIGNWHDNILALELFSTAGLNDKQVVTKIKRQNTRLKRSITVLAYDFLKKVIEVQAPKEDKQ